MTNLNHLSQPHYEELKVRNWAFLMYTENLPEFGVWKQFLIDSGAEICVSPLHDQDRITNEDYESHKKYFDESNQKVGDLKKPHYHVIVCYPGPTTQNAIYKRICEPLHATKPFSLINVCGYYRYLYHDQDEFPDKHEYKKSDLIKIGGFDIKKYIDLSSSQAFETRKRIVQFILLNGIQEYSELYRYYFATNQPIELKVVDTCKSFFTTFLNSQRYSNQDYKLMYKELDPTTGEIVNVTIHPDNAFIGV